MSQITTLSIKDEHESKYNALRNYLKEKNCSIGDYLMSKWDSDYEGNFSEDKDNKIKKLEEELKNYKDSLRNLLNSWEKN